MFLSDLDNSRIIDQLPQILALVVNFVLISKSVAVSIEEFGFSIFYLRRILRDMDAFGFMKLGKIRLL